VSALLAQGQSLSEITASGIGSQVMRAYHIWVEAPRLGGIPLVCDLPALLITLVITAIVFVGIEESRRTSNFLVGIKLAVVLLVIVVGATYVVPENWQPFAPNGISGVLKGVSGVFFAYIGFDALSTTAEECRNPQRDLPRGMLNSLVICTILYVLVSLVLTGIMPYHKLGVGDPLSFVFGPEGANVAWLQGVVNISAVVALATVLLVFQTGQPRIWMVMSRDGLLPPVFSRIHPRFNTPWVSTLVAGCVVAIPTLFMSLSEVTDLTSIGTLFAFALVSGGLLKLELDGKKLNSRFKITYINAQYIFPLLMLLILLAASYFRPAAFSEFFSLVDHRYPDAGLWFLLGEKFPLAFFIVLMVFLAVLCFRHKLSLIPVLALSSCTYLMTELGITNWLRFGLWLVVGMVIYFLYGIKHSKLNRTYTQPR
jgi:amino acid transporter